MIPSGLNFIFFNPILTHNKMERKQKYVMMISDKEEAQDDDKMNPENISE